MSCILSINFSCGQHKPPRSVTSEAFREAGDGSLARNTTLEGVYLGV